MHVLARAGLLAVPTAVVLAIFVEACGAFHGTPGCGPASAAAIPVVVFALAAEGLVFNAPQNDAAVRLLIWASSYLIAFVLCFCALYLVSLGRRH